MYVYIYIYIYASHYSSRCIAGIYLRIKCGPQFSASAQDGSCMVFPVSQQFLQGCAQNSTNVGLTEHIYHVPDLREWNISHFLSAFLSFRQSLLWCSGLSMFRQLLKPLSTSAMPSYEPVMMSAALVVLSDCVIISQYHSSFVHVSPRSYQVASNDQHQSAALISFSQWSSGKIIQREWLPWLVGSLMVRCPSEEQETWGSVLAFPRHVIPVLQYFVVTLSGPWHFGVCVSTGPVSVHCEMRQQVWSATSFLVS